MGIIGSITGSTQVVAQGLKVNILNIDFISHTSDVTVTVVDGGSGGTTKWSGFIDATTGTGDDRFPKNFSEKGGSLNDGLYIGVSGTTTVNYEYDPQG